jgi:ribosome-associated protein
VEPGGDVELRGGLKVPASDLVWRTSKSGGPGGQHANTSNTRVELVFEVAKSSLPEWAQARILARCTDPVKVIAADERSLWQNRRLAMVRLQTKLDAALAPTIRRVPTRPSRGSVQRRLDAKQANAERKAQRRRPLSEH